MHHLRRAAAAATVAALALPAIAAAHPGQRNFTETYPVASRLCARVAAGFTPKAMTGDTSQITSACAQLNTSFTNAQNTYATAVAPLRQQALTAIQQLRQTCNQARQSGDVATCHQTHQQTRVTLQGLRAQVRSAARAYHVAVQAARRAFWSTIRALKGGATLPEDTTVGPGPTSPIPATPSVPSGS